MKWSKLSWIPILLVAVFLGSPLAASQHMSPPAFADIDANGDGVIDPEEFAQHQAARMAERHGGQTAQGQGKGKGQGKGQGHGSGKGHHGAPAYGDLDLDGNGCIDSNEFAEHVAERHGAAPAED